jgi:site-specific DNA recombinase
VSLRQIARDWNAAGLRTSFGGNEFDSREVRKILLRPRNAGIVLHKGKPVGGAVGKWHNIVDLDTFHALEALLGDPSRRISASTERKYQGSGVYVCGKCGAPMIASAHNRSRGSWRRTYTCSKSKHVARDVEHLDAYVDQIVLDRLSQPDAAVVLGGSVVGIDISGLHAKRDELRGRLDALSVAFAEGSIDASQLKSGSANLHSQLNKIDAQLAAARSASVLANLVLAGDDLHATWEASPPEVRGKVIDALMTVTVLPGARGRKPGGGYFDPASVRIDWRAP